MTLYRLPLVVLPLESKRDLASGDAEKLSRDLSRLGYPGFTWLPPGPPKNPAAVLLAILSSDDLEVRLVEAAPWVVMRYPDLDWEWLLREAKLREVQNRLGFVVSLARKLVSRDPGRHGSAAKLAKVEAALDRVRLVREDTLCQRSLPEAERLWLRARRPPEAEHWNLLTDLSVEQLPYAA